MTVTYTFDEGHSDTLRWTVHKLGEGQYTGYENRLEGEATGEQAGCAFHWKYTRDTPQGDGKSFKLNFDDWFYAIDDRVCIVRDGACDLSEAIRFGRGTSSSVTRDASSRLGLLHRSANAGIDSKASRFASIQSSNRQFAVTQR
nr:DUF3833 family protein [Bradyrhizobium diazoefficiens]